MFSILYVYPKLSKYDLIFFRASGHGLGNLLFPFARAIVYAKKKKVPVIWPTWNQLKIGPIIRGEKDKRTYHNLFVRTKNYIGGIEKIKILALSKKISETESIKSWPKSKMIVKEFSGMEGMFNPILRYREFIKSELFSITRRHHLKGYYYDFNGSISVHIRLGDFKETKNFNKLKKGKSNYRIPLSWYIEKIENIRDYFKSEIPVYVFSDGADDELSPILSLRSSKRVFFGSSLADLWALSKSNVLIASNSTFSMWASYLGEMPVVWYKINVKTKLNNEEIESQEYQDIPNDFLEKLNMCFKEGRNLKYE